MKSGAGLPQASYRVWVVMITIAYTNDLLAHLARKGFVVEADDPSSLKGKSAAIFSCRLAITPRLAKDRRAKAKQLNDAAGVKCEPENGHQPEAIAFIVEEVLHEQKMLFHTVIVAACEDAGWLSGNIDLGAIETYRQNEKSRLS